MPQSTAADVRVLHPVRWLPLFRRHSLRKTQTRFSCNPPNAPTARRKLPSVRLGGKKRRRRFSVFRLFKRLKLRWLRLQYVCMLKKLKSFYASIVKDLVNGGATIEAVQKRILLEAYYTVPIMPMSLTVCPPMHKHALL